MSCASTAEPDYPRAILHADADAFFASVEQALDPSLRGRPVAVGAERGLAVSVSYEAKRSGVVRGMLAWEIRRKCPSCAIVPGHYDAYGLFSERMMSIFRRYASDVEESSIDEAFADLSGLTRLHRGGYRDIAAGLQQAVKLELGVTVSVGVSLTRTLAKVCSRRHKPEGLTCVPAGSIRSFLETVAVEDVCGIGPASQELLFRRGIRTAGDYVRTPDRLIRGLLGKTGVDLWHELQGRGVYPIVSSSKPAASLQRARTFTPSTGERAFVRAEAFDNLEIAFSRLRADGFRTSRVGLMLKDAEFRCHAAEARLPHATDSTIEAAPAAAALFDKLFRKDLKYRQTTVWLGGFESGAEPVRDLFEDPERLRSLRALSSATDRINSRYGRRTLRLGSSLSGKSLPRPLRRPAERDDLAGLLRIPSWNITV